MDVAGNGKLAANIRYFIKSSYNSDQNSLIKYEKNQQRGNNLRIIDSKASIKTIVCMINLIIQFKCVAEIV